jgi:hypothetical protein
MDNLTTREQENIKTTEKKRKKISHLVYFLLHIWQEVEQAGGNKNTTGKARGEADDQLPSSGEIDLVEQADLVVLTAVIFNFLLFNSQLLHVPIILFLYPTNLS